MRMIAPVLALLVVSMPCPVRAGLLANSVSSFKVAADLSRRAAQEAAVRQAAAILTSVIASTPDADGDAFPEPPPFVTGAGPAGGGLLPVGVGAPLSDGYGGMLGYCAWDNGAVVSGGNRLAGSVSDTGAPAFAVVSSGLDGVFNRTCAEIAAGANGVNDDLVVAISTAQIRQGVGGTVYFADPVANPTALNGLVGLRDGELRLAKSDNTLWRWDATVPGWTTVSNTYTASNVSVTGGSINGTIIGNVTPTSGAFTTLTGILTGNVTGNVKGNVTGNLTGDVTGNLTGNATTATRLLSSSMIGITGDATWSVSFDGSANVSGVLALSPTGVAPGTYGSAIATPVFAVDAAGRIVAAGNSLITPDWSAISGKPTTLGGYGISGIDGVAIGATTPSSGAFTTLSASGALNVGGAVTAASFIGSGAALTNLDAGNIATGILAVARGGTGVGTTPANGQLLIGNGSGYTLGGLTGTANQIIVTPGSGSITLSLPQDIATTSTPSFDGLTLNGPLSGATATFTTVKTGNGTVSAPGYAFSADGTSGLYRPATGQLAASVASTRSMWITSGSVSLGSGALPSDSAPTTSNNVAVGPNALNANTTGFTNTAVGYRTLGLNVSGSDNAAFGASALRLSTGDSNSGLGSGTLYSNTTGSWNTAIGRDALNRNVAGSYNVASGIHALYWNDAANNTAIGSKSLGKNTTGTNNAALGYAAADTATVYLTGSNSTFIGANASIADTAQMASASNITLLGAAASASGLGASNLDAYMTAIGAGAGVQTINTVVLGRPADSTVIGAMADDLSGYKLQVTGGIKAFTGGLNIAGGDLVLGSGTVSGLVSARPNYGVPDRIYIGTDTNTIYRDTGSAWVALGSAGAASLSSVTAATAGNTIANGAFAQNWNWQLAGNTSAFLIGETAASTGGSGTQYLLSIGTQVGSTASPLRVASRGVEAFRIDSANPQIVAHVGSAAAPGYSFNGSQTTGFYSPATNTIGASVNGTRSMWITNGSAALGYGSLVADASNNSTAVGTQALASNTSGSQNVGIGYQALQNNTTGNDNTAVGYGSLAAAVTNRENSAFGSGALGKTIGNSSTAIGFQALTNATTGDENVAVGAFSLQSNVDGRSNLAVGTGSLRNNVNGNFNTALGTAALYANQSGGDNVSVGGDSMNSNTTGARNVAVGTHALRGNIGGDENVAIGNSSMLNNLTGSSNVSIGSQAMFSNTASDNTAVGFAALRANVSGTANTAMGRGALYSTSSDNNSAFGYYALVQNTAGTLNVAMGNNALSGNTLGNSNVAIGSRAGQADSVGNGYFANTIGSNNTFIGASAIPGTTSRLDYATVIGSDASVTTSKSVVLGRASVYASGLPTGDRTIIGATGDSGAAAVLQVNGASQHIGLASAPTGTAGMMYYNAVANQFQYYNGTAWNNFGAGGGASLSALTSASATNTLDNAAYAQSWNWQLTADGSAFSIGETAASSGGNGAQYLMNIGTLAGSTAIPLRVVSRGLEAFRIDSVNPQIVAHAGSAAAPSYSFNGSQGTGFYSPAANMIGASVNGTRSMWITNGSVGLGYASLAADVSNNSTALGTQALAANTTGWQNVGVGYQALQINTTGSDNTAVGYQTLSSLNGGRENSAFGSGALHATTANDSTAVGFQALNANTTGDQNTAIGAFALKSNQSGSNNVAAGAKALANNTAGTFNIAVGVGTLEFNLTGRENVAIGHEALANNTQDGNTAVGTRAMKSNQSGGANTAVGIQALTSNTTAMQNVAVGASALQQNNGLNNTAVGTNAMRENTSGTDNVALGLAALKNNLASADNTAIGSEALFNTTGQRNTALGRMALKDTSSGYNNVAVGWSAGFAESNGNGGNANISGYNNTFIGASAMPGTTTPLSYATALGSDAIVTTSATVVLGRAIDSVVVGGTAAGGELFHVYGTAGGTSGFATSSDIRYKTNITPVINALETIGNLKGVHYEFNQAAFPHHGFESGRQLGFIAQQIEPFVPEVVRTDRFGFKSVQYSQLVPLLAEGINAQQLILKHLALKDPATLLVDVKTFQGNDAVFENIKATGIKVALLEAETARIKKLEADSIESKLVRSDVVKSGEIEVFVSMGSFQPIFVPLADAQYIVNATADDGSTAFASVAFMGGKITVTPISGKGVDVTAMGSQVGLVAASKKIKATWIRMS